MHSLLESYLSEVAAHLSILPAARRNEELREIQAHLLSASAAYQELGETEQEAVEATLRQFGTESEVAADLVRAWRRQQGNWRDAAKAGVFSAASLWGVYGLCGFLGQSLESHHAAFSTLWAHLEPVFYALFFGLSALPGLLCGERFARSAVKGAIWGASLGYVGPIVVYEVIHAWTDSDIIGVSLITLMQAVCLTGAVWASRRRREKRTLPARLVGG